MVCRIFLFFRIKNLFLSVWQKPEMGVKYPFSQYQRKPNISTRPKNLEHTCDKNKAAIQSNESSKTVKETSEINLLLKITVWFAHILELNHPAWEINAYPFVPIPQIQQLNEKVYKASFFLLDYPENKGKWNRNSLKMMQWESFLAGFKDIP